MKYVITFAPKIEDILIEELKAYFYNEIRFADIYPKFGNIRVSNVHPFAFLIDQDINGTAVDVELFPSITVVSENDRKAEINIPALQRDIKINAAEVADIVARSDMYQISAADLTALQDLTTGESFVWSLGAGTNRQDSVSVEIWSENIDLKNRVYDLVEAFFVGPKRYEIKTSHEVNIHEEGVSGQRSGNYNFDFGKTLYGGVVTLQADYQINQYFVDTTIVDIAGITHTYQEVKNA